MREVDWTWEPIGSELVISSGIKIDGENAFENGKAVFKIVYEEPKFNPPAPHNTGEASQESE